MLASADRARGPAGARVGGGEEMAAVGSESDCVKAASALEDERLEIARGSVGINC
jgi:hypothetical protein